MASNKDVLLAEADAQSWTSVRSSNVESVAYSDDFARLYVRFKGGAIYVYHTVPRGVFDGLLSAPSKGQYVFYVLRGKGTDSVYPYDQLR